LLAVGGAIAVGLRVPRLKKPSVSVYWIAVSTDFRVVVLIAIELGVLSLTPIAHHTFTKLGFDESGALLNRRFSLCKWAGIWRGGLTCPHSFDW